MSGLKNTRGFAADRQPAKVQAVFSLTEIAISSVVGVILAYAVVGVYDVVTI